MGHCKQEVLFYILYNNILASSYMITHGGKQPQAAADLWQPCQIFQAKDKQLVCHCLRLLSNPGLPCWSPI